MSIHEKEGVFFHPPLSPLIIGNCSSVSFRSGAPFHSGACKPHKSPILINHFLFIILPFTALSEFSLHWDVKDRCSLEPLNRHLVVSLRKYSGKLGKKIKANIYESQVMYFYVLTNRSCMQLSVWNSHLFNALFT